jgi:caa(3)-type oxidase subunit IV
VAHNAHARPNYVAVWAWLLILLFISLGAVYLPFSHGITVTFIFVVAAVKAFLVAANFMGLRFEERFVWWVGIVPVVLFVILVLGLIPDVGYQSGWLSTAAP